MEKHYFTSDLHFFHKNICKYAERKDYLPLDNTRCLQMNWDIVNSINKQLPDEEGVILWNLGDVFYGELFTERTLAELQALIATMKGKHRKLYLVEGNHDRQFKDWADWEKLAPLTKEDSLETIFKTIGFDKYFDKPVEVNPKIILSHEPVFLPKNSEQINIHGHTHQIPVTADTDKGETKYFCWTLENSEMVRKAYKDSDRKVPELVLKKNWKSQLTYSKFYYNCCWDYHDYQVVAFEDILQELENDYTGQKKRNENE